MYNTTTVYIHTLCVCVCVCECVCVCGIMCCYTYVVLFVQHMKKYLECQSRAFGTGTFTFLAGRVFLTLFIIQQLR